MALSHFPILGTGTLIGVGLPKELDYLLEAPTSIPLSCGSIHGKIRYTLCHIFSGGENRPRSRRCITKPYEPMLYPKASSTRDPIPLVSGLPRLTKSCTTAFKKDTFLRCSCLVTSSDSSQGKYDHEVAKRLKEAGKISFLDVGLV